MRTETEITEQMRTFALRAAAANDARWGSPSEFLQCVSGAFALGWALGLEKQDAEDMLAVAVIEHYRESPSIIESYFQGEIPERFKVHL